MQNNKIYKTTLRLNLSKQTDKHIYDLLTSATDEGISINAYIINCILAANNEPNYDVQQNGSVTPDAAFFKLLRRLIGEEFEKYLKNKNLSTLPGKIDNDNVSIMDKMSLNDFNINEAENENDKESAVSSVGEDSDESTRDDEEDDDLSSGAKDFISNFGL